MHRTRTKSPTIGRKVERGFSSQHLRGAMQGVDRQVLADRDNREEPHKIVVLISSTIKTKFEIEGV